MTARLMLGAAVVLALSSPAAAQVITPGNGYPDSWQVQIYPVIGDPCGPGNPPGCIMTIGDIMHLYLGEGLGVYNNPSNSTSSAQCGLNGPAPAASPNPIANPDVIIWTDPVDPTKYCWAGVPPNFLISFLADGTQYVFRMATMVGSLVSPEGPPSGPFIYKVPIAPAQAGTVILADVSSGPPPPPPAPDPLQCVPPLGPQSLAMFITDWSATTGRPGSRAHVDFQITSLSAITKLRARLNGADVAAAAGNDVGSLWFTTPASGTYALTVYAENAYGCTRETMSPRTVVVP